MKQFSKTDDGDTLLDRECVLYEAILGRPIDDGARKVLAARSGREDDLGFSLAMQLLFSSEFMDKLVSMLENPDRSAAALTLVESMQRTAVGALLARLPRIRTSRARRQLSDAITARVPEADVLCAAVKTGVIFEAGKNKKRAKEFVTFMLEDQNLQPYVEGSLGRWYPVTKSGTHSAFWQADPARKAGYNQFGAGTVTFEFAKNYKVTVLNNENVWAKAMSRVVNDGWTPEKATDEMIARNKQVAG